jgi:hypothetical protein
MEFVECVRETTAFGWHIVVWRGFAEEGRIHIQKLCLNCVHGAVDGVEKSVKALVFCFIEQFRIDGSAIRRLVQQHMRKGFFD